MIRVPLISRRATPNRERLMRQIERLAALRSRIRPMWWAYAVLLAIATLLAWIAALDWLFASGRSAAIGYALLAIAIGMTIALHRHCRLIFPFIGSMIIAAFFAQAPPPNGASDFFVPKKKPTIVDRITDAIERRKRLLTTLDR